MKICVLFCLCSFFSFSFGLFENEEENNLLFLNILYVWNERIVYTEKYIKEAEEIFYKMEKIDISMMKRFRNPAVKESQPLILPEEMVHFLNLVKKTTSIFNEYVLLTDLGKQYLSEDRKSILKEIKKKALYKILTQLLTIKHILSFCQKLDLLFHETRSFDKMNINAVLLLGDAESPLKKTFSFNVMQNVSYYKDSYLAIDRLFIKIFESLFRTKEVMRNYLKDFWVFVQHPLLIPIKEMYNDQALVHLTRYKKIKKIMFENDSIPVLSNIIFLSHEI